MSFEIVKPVRRMIRQGQVPRIDWNEVSAILNRFKTEGINLNLLKYITLQRPGQLAESSLSIASGKILLIMPMTILSVSVYVQTASSNGSIDIDVHVGSTPADAGTSVYSGNPKPSIAQGALTDLDVPPDANLSHIDAGKYIHADIDATGEGAKDFTAIIWGKGK